MNVTLVNPAQALWRRVHRQLESGPLGEAVPLLFLEVLGWGAGQGRPQHVAVLGEPRALTPIALLGGFPVFLTILRPDEEEPTVGLRRAFHEALRETSPEHLMVYIAHDQRQAHIVSARRTPRGQTEFRALPYRSGTVGRTTVERLAELAFTLDELGPTGQPPITAVLDKVKRAFDVEAVTDQFFEDYRETFNQVEAAVVMAGTPDQRRLFTQRLFNRLMFLHFLSKKGWLSFRDDLDYIAALWRDRAEEGSFYADRLLPLFFRGLNNPAAGRLREADPDLYALIGDVPYLNGGLFEQGADEGQGEAVSDEACELILDLLGRHNFTITESTSLDVVVAVDPEMLGKVFEELVTDRHETGAYYTMRLVVAFMCREALKGYLTAVLHPGRTAVSPDIARFVDGDDPSGLTDPEAVLSALKRVKVCDLACGSGAYLLGMMQELLRLREVLFAAHAQDYALTYSRKLEIIERNLYGVDRAAFAVNVAMLRLWLSLVVDDNRNPLLDRTVDVSLPNLKFKVQCGDSLLAPAPDGAALNLHAQQYAQDASRLRALYDEYFTLHQADGGRTKEEVEGEIDAAQGQIARLMGSQAPRGSVDWRVCFAEVFAPETPASTWDGRFPFANDVIAQQAFVATAPDLANGGFDIILANPPYVRQELIGDNKPALQRMYAEAAEGQSDLYVYFYARAMQLLRPGGQHIFICSNSWLDVAYGGKLQEYLLNHAWVQAVYDSRVERQFATADINTVISMARKGRPADEAQTRFVSLLAPFEEALADPDLRREVTRTRTQLWAAGLGEPNRNGVRSFDGDKWGGKYLRSPDVYERIMERGRDRLVRLDSLANVRFGIKTGANDFFFVRVLGIENGVARIRCDDDSEHTIEAEYVADPVLVKAREVNRPRMRREDLQYRLLRLDAAASRRRHAGAYIRWGEAQGYHTRPTTRNRNPWYKADTRNASDIFIPIGHKRRPVVGLCPDVLASDNLVEVTLQDRAWGRVVAGSVLAAFTLIVYEITGRANFGQGLLKTQTYEVAALPVLDPHQLAADVRAAFETAFDDVADRAPLMIYDEVSRPDRIALDDAFLRAVGFDTATERAALLPQLHEAACRMIWARQAKAETTREARQTYDEWLATGLPFGGGGEDV